MSAPRAAFKTLWRRAVGRTPAEWAINLLVMLVLFGVLGSVLSWALVSATPPWSDATACAANAGACWPFLIEKTPLILFGTFPYDERWRAMAVSVVLQWLFCQNAANEDFACNNPFRAWRSADGHREPCKRMQSQRRNSRDSLWT